MKVLLTGATGFVGRGLLESLSAAPEIRVRAVVRSVPAGFPPVDVCRIDGLSASQDWTEALQGIDVIVHAAARVHVMHEMANDPLSAFRAINVDATLNLARQAAAAGVKRFIFLSSIKVNGEFTPMGRPFTEDAVPAPVDPYGQSKLEAERALHQLAGESGLEVVIIRPPLVYGSGVGANFASLMGALYRRRPLPFALVDNRRSLVARDNLVDFIRLCLNHPKAANQVFLVSDGEDLSTAALCRRLSAALGVQPRLLPVPVVALRALALLTGKQAQMQRLLGSLQVDIGKARRLLDWRPPISVDQALDSVARWYRESGR
ncbi:UDP-glucose 4-epimerase family protein [Pseudomonas panipatensis]|nr:SDR family oxidoreductase [Pseudomonas panipatensis]